MKYIESIGVVKDSPKKLMLVGIALAFTAASTIAFVNSSSAATAVVWDQGFEIDKTGWYDTSSLSPDDWYGTITRVPSGTNGITSSEGSFHAVFEGDEDSAPFSRFDGYRDTWTGQYTAEVDVYLDPSWATGTGFDYSVAASGSDGAHQRDYIFHVGVVEGYGLLVNGSNNADFKTNSYKLLNDNGGNYYTVGSEGWYTLQHVFYEDAGALAVDLNLVDLSGTILWTATRYNTADTIPAEVGGNRYAWFTHIDVAGGIAVDNHQLFLTLPNPEDKNECKKGGWEAFGFKNQGLCIQYTNTGKDSR